MHRPVWLTLAFTVLISGTGYGQHPPPEIPRLIEGAEKAARENSSGRIPEGTLNPETFSKEIAERFRKSRVSALAQTPRNFILQGGETTTATGLQSLVDDSFQGLLMSLGRDAAPVADQGAIFHELQANNQNRWFWARQKLTLASGGILEVKPALLESGDVRVSMPSLSTFYESAMKKMGNIQPFRPIIPSLKDVKDMRIQLDGKR